MKKMEKIFIWLLLMLSFLNVYADNTPEKSYRNIRVILKELVIGNSNDTLRLGLGTSQNGQLLRYNSSTKVWSNWTDNYGSLYNITSLNYTNGKLYVTQGGNVDSTSIITVDTSNVVGLVEMIQDYSIDAESDPIYTSDSSFINIGIREWNSSVAKTIDASDTTRWAEGGGSGVESDPIYSNDSSFIKSNIRDWNSSVAKLIISEDTTYWNSKLDIEIDPLYENDSSYIKQSIRDLVDSLSNIYTEVQINTFLGAKADTTGGVIRRADTTGLFHSNRGLLDLTTDTFTIAKANAIIANTGKDTTGIYHFNRALLDGISTTDTTWWGRNETDPFYSTDSSFLKSGIRDWNSSTAKNITSDDTVYWDNKLDVELDPIYVVDSSFIKSGIRSWDSSISKGITGIDTAYWNDKVDSEVDPIYSNDSTFLNTGVRDWNSSLAKTIDANDTTYWGRPEADPKYITDSSFVKSGVRDWNASVAKGISSTDTANWNSSITGGEPLYITDSSYIKSNIRDLSGLDTTGIYHSNRALLDAIDVSDTIHWGRSEVDPVYSSDSSFIKTGIRSWDSSIAKTIDASDTTRWGRDEIDPIYSNDSSFIKTTLREIVVDTASWNAKQDALTNPVTSPNAGVSGYIPVYSGATTIDTCGIFVSGSNVGIGTNPIEKLQITNTSTIAVRVSDAENNIRFKQSAANNPTAAIGFSTGGSTGFQAGLVFSAYDGSSWKNNLYILNSGGVGVGTLSIDANTMLKVNGYTDITGSLNIQDRLKFVNPNNLYNIFLGDAGIANTTGNNNVGIGSSAFSSNTTGFKNVAVGGLALEDNTTAEYNTAIGHGALRNNTTASHNTAVGGDALNANTIGANNSAFGVDALQRNTIGSYNTAVGNSALVFNTIGDQNVGLGVNAVFSNDSGSYNTGVGVGGLYGLVSGSYNVGVGGESGRTLTVGNYNTFVGYYAGYNGSQKVNAENSTAIGYGAYTTADNQVVIGNENITQTLLKGNVGIKNTTPSKTLDVNGSAIADSVFARSAVSAPLFTGNLTGNVTGNTSGSSGSCTGNAATATKLAATKTINGVAFDGSGNITVPSDIAPGTSGNVLTSNGTVWTSAAAASGFADPMTTRGDIIVRGSGGTTRLALGTTGKVLISDGTDLVYSTSALGTAAYVTLGSNVGTFLATPSSANLASALTDETGTGSVVFSTSPTLVTPALGTPSAGVVTNLTGTASININGTVGATTPNTIVGTTIQANTGLIPDANDGAYIGTTTAQFSDLFLAEGGVINFDNGDATITQVGDVVTVAGADLKVTTPGNASTSVVTTDGTQTLTNKTLTTPTLTLSTTTSSTSQTLAFNNMTKQVEIGNTTASVPVNFKKRQALTSGTTMAMDFLSGSKASFVIGHDATLTISNIPDGEDGIITVTQDASTARTLAIAGGTGFTTERIFGGNAVIDATLSSRTKIVYERVNDELHISFIYEN